MEEPTNRRTTILVVFRRRCKRVSVFTIFSALTTDTDELLESKTIWADFFVLARFRLLMESTSLTLLTRLRTSGDESAWRRFVELYTPLLHLWARRAGLPETEAADIAQDVLLTVTNEMPTFAYDRDRKNFRGWLKTITINCCRDRQRKKTPLNAADVGSAVFECVAGPASDEFWEREYQHHLFQQALKVMKAEFETKTWRACWETAVNERPVKDVAAELGMTTAAVYVAKSRVLRRLRQELWEFWQ